MKLFLILPFFFLPPKTDWKTIVNESGEKVKKEVKYDLRKEYKGWIPPSDTTREWIEPPGSFEIMKWYWTEFPKTYNGWRVDFREKMSVRGWTSGWILSEVSFTCDTCGYLSKYVYDIELDYGHGNTTSLEVTQNKDSTDLYLSRKHR